MAAPELQFLQAPQANLQTWSIMTKLLLISTTVVTAVLLLLFWAFV